MYIGVPVEAEAISSAFFPNKRHVASELNTLYVGSIEYQIYHRTHRRRCGLSCASEVLLFRETCNHSAQYAFQHIEIPDRTILHESQYSRAERLRHGPVNQLLGHITPDSAEHERRWRNILKSKEIPWIDGHSLQEHRVFPAATYVVLALEATLQIANSSPITLIEISNLELAKALTFDHDNMAMETLLSVANINRLNEIESM